MVETVADLFYASLGRDLPDALAHRVDGAWLPISHRELRIRVERLDGQRPGLGRALVRSLLLVAAVPAWIWDRDQRGLHDQAAGTLVVRR